MKETMHRALILDFDGLILDTEWCEYVSWSRIYEEHGVTLALPDWLKAVGYVGNFDPIEHLSSLAAMPVEWATVLQRRKEIAHSLVVDLTPLPGVQELLLAGKRDGWRIGLASNSTSEWVRGGLRRLGLESFFETVVTRDRVGRHKPHPEPYLTALAELDGDPTCSIAFEDSEPGVLSAKAANLRVIAVPNRLTRHQDLSAADLYLQSLLDFQLPVLLAP